MANATVQESLVELGRMERVLPNAAQTRSTAVLNNTLAFVEILHRRRLTLGAIHRTPLAVVGSDHYEFIV